MSVLERQNPQTLLGGFGSDKWRWSQEICQDRILGSLYTLKKDPVVLDRKLNKCLTSVCVCACVCAHAWTCVCVGGVGTDIQAYLCKPRLSFSKYPDLLNQSLRVWGPRIYVFNKLPGDSDARSSLKTITLVHVIFRQFSLPPYQ